MQGVYKLLTQAIFNGMSRSFTVANMIKEIRNGGFALIDDSGPKRTSLGTWILKDPQKVIFAATPQSIARMHQWRVSAV